MAGGAVMAVTERNLTVEKSLAGDAEIEIDYQPARTGDVQHSCADITAISRLLGYTTKIGTERALQACINPTLP